MAAWSAWQASSTLDRLQAGQPLTEGEFARARENLEAAVQWEVSSQRLSKLATLELAEAFVLKSSDQRRQQILERAERQLAEALVRDPSNALAWFNLARVWSLNGEGGRRVATALIESLHAAPGARAIWVERADLLMRHWRLLDESEFQVLQSQLRAIAASSAKDRARLFEAALALGELRLAAAAAASNDPSARDSLEQMKRELVSGSPQKGLN